METNSIEIYESPKIEIIEVEVEKGFAQSMVPDHGNW